jgi:hypothetical protein
MMIKAPEPGVYPGVPFTDYLSWDAASNSQLTTLSRSPAHLAESRRQPREDTPALVMGRAIHTACLEPQLFASQYVRGIEGDGRTKAVKEARAKLIVENPTKEVLSATDHDDALEIATTLRARPTSGALLSVDGMREVSIVWDDDATGLRCKARIDLLSDLDGGTVLDLKSTQDARRDPFERSIYTYGYYRQAAFYLAGCYALGIAARHFMIVAVEKTRPYLSQAYRITDEAIEVGANEVSALLEVWAECLATGVYPGYDEAIHDIGLPPWAWQKAADAANDRAREGEKGGPNESGDDAD